MTEIQQLPDGLYANLTFEEYLGQARMSSSDLTHLTEGPAAFWAQSWMNPDKPERVETEPMKLGSAYHCARLEPEEFEERYVREIDPEDFDDPTGETQLLTNGTQIGDALAALGQPKKKSGESVREQALRLRDALNEADAPGPVYIWMLELEKFAEVNAGKIMIDRKQWDEIKRDQQRLRMNPEVAALFSDGVAETSILWTDPQTGIKCKARPDYLTPAHCAHLKTWDSRSPGKPGNRAISDNFMYSGHHRTTWFYLMGLEAIRAGDVKVMDKDAELEAIAHQIAKRKAPVETVFVYVRRSGIPDIRARKIKLFALPPGIEEQAIGTSTEAFRYVLTSLGRKAQQDTEACLLSYVQNLEIFGDEGEPWFPRDLTGLFEDDDFSGWWLDSRDDPR